MPQHLQRIDHEQYHDNCERQRINIRWYAQRRAINKAKYAQCPYNPENRCQFH